MTKKHAKLLSRQSIKNLFFFFFFEKGLEPCFVQTHTKDSKAESLNFNLLTLNKSRQHFKIKYFSYCLQKMIRQLHEMLKSVFWEK